MRHLICRLLGFSDADRKIEEHSSVEREIDQSLSDMRSASWALLRATHTERESTATLAPTVTAIRNMSGKVAARIRELRERA